MSIQMALNNMQKETIRKEEPKQSEIKEEPVNTSSSVYPGSTSEISRINPANNPSDIGKAVQSNKNDTRRAFDQYIREKSDEQNSYGHYKLVSDENGNQKIEFSEPANNPKENSDETTAAEISDKGNTENISEDSQKIQKLKKKKQQLKHLILSETDSRKAEQLKKELAQIERQLTSKKYK